MSELVLTIFLSLLLIFFLFLISKLEYKKPKNKEKKMQKIPLFYVSKNSTKIKRIKRVKDGNLISFVSQGEIVCLEESLNFSDFLNDDFYQNNYLNFIKKMPRDEKGRFTKENLDLSLPHPFTIHKYLYNFLNCFSLV